MHALYQLLTRLDSASVWYRIDRCRPDTVLVTVTVPGERLEIDVFDDGHIEYSRFTGDEGVETDESALDKLLSGYLEDEKRFSSMI
jgi:hypothetical protein